MPSTLNAPVLQVDANIIRQVDTSNPQNLFNLWCMLSRCADALPQGRRLENLVWRLLMEEVPSETAPQTATSLPREIQRPARKSSAEDVPRLSASVESLENDEEAVEFSSDYSPLDISRPRIRRQDSCTSTRSRHISSENLEKMVSSIVEQKESLSSPLPVLPPLASPPKEEEPLMLPPPELIRSGSTTTESPSKDSDGLSDYSSQGSLDMQANKTTVVRGFSPSQRPVPAVFTPPRTSSEIPAPKSSPAAKNVESKKSRAKFLLGGSSEESYSDHGHSVETRPTLAPPAPKKKMFQIGGSSEEDSSLKSALASPRHHGLLGAHKKQTSFANNLTTEIPSASSAVIDEDDESCYDESAIDDDDEDWEDSNEEESSKNSVDEKTFFQRVDSNANLTSRRSLITLALESNQRRGPASHLGNVASQSTSAIPLRARNHFNGPSMVASPNDSDDAPLMMKRKPRGGPLRSINEIPRSSAQPIAPTSNGVSQPIAFSPRTTRRNMMSTELTESLRRHLLWERSQKTSTANAVLKRRHTSQDVANLKQYPQQAHMNRDNNDVNASSWDQEFTREAFAGYHTKGW